ncbi:DUF6355 family natural product biosynthesis protein [Umezawaea tangerina]|nr:DUF6355 family natural product biosynthesis protein [Umezawaea tangerina]
MTIAESASAQVAKDGTCGFYFTNPDHNSATARYLHCGNSFILIQVDWSNGWHQRECVPPWYSVPFYPDGPHRVVNAYYVPVAPDLIDDGQHRICRTGQPQE